MKSRRGEMAADPRVGERVYAQIKDAILRGDLRLRQRLDIEALALQTRASATPVRQALTVLTTERLVRSDGARGYQVAFWSEKELRALYLWRWQLARLAVDDYVAGPMAISAQQRRHHAEYYGLLMRHLEARCHDDLLRAARNADERLSAALRAEPDVLERATRDLEFLQGALSSESKRVLAVRLRAYFKRRVIGAALIRARASVSALPRNGE